MGIFEVSEANRTLHCLEIKAYDFMLRFETDFNGFETVGNAYAFLALCCKACDVELAHTQSEIEGMPNDLEMLSVYTENDIETYRDVLFYVGQVLGGFFCINRAGKLELRKYGNQPVMTVSDKLRFSSSFSDFITRYTAVSSTNIKTQISEYYASELDDGLTMNLGDVLVFSGGHADEMQQACITGYQIKIDGKHSLKCVGKNPRLAQAKSKNDKNISGLLNQIEAGKIGIHTFTNASAYTISGADTKIISIEFAAAEETHVQFFAIVLVDVKTVPEEKSGMAKGTIVVPVPAVDAAGVIGTVDVSVEAELPVTLSIDAKSAAYIKYEFNDEEILIHHPTETWGSGKHVLPLYYPIEKLIPNYTNTLNVYLRIDRGEGQIETGGCVASVSGQGMAAAPAWDGKITLEETVGMISIGGKILIKKFTDSMKVETMELVQRQLSDSMGRVNVGAFCMPIEMR